MGSQFGAYGETGEYEEMLENCLRGTDLARETQNVFLLWINLVHLGWAYEALLDLEKARRVHEEAPELKGALGLQYEEYTSLCLCGVGPLSETGKKLTPTPRRHTRVVGPPSTCRIFSTSITWSKRCFGEEMRVAPEKRSVVLPSAPGPTSGLG